uniref:Protein TSSC4 n=1 Tax=Rhabditophanes sp. KR3021 TaxID=114890 RepID=A0AC35UFU7_9BILA
MNTSGESKWSSELVLNNEPEEQENGIPISMEDHTLLRSQSFPISYQLTEQEPAKTTESDEPSKKRSMKNCDEDCPLPKTKKNVEPEYGFQIFERLKKKLDLKISLKNDEMMTYDEYHRRHGVNIFKDKNFDPVVDLMSRVDSLVEDFNEESESSFVDTPVEDAEPECPLTGTLLSTIMQARYPK